MLRLQRRILVAASCLLLLPTSCRGASSGSQSANPNQFAEAAPGESGTLAELFGDDWSVAVVATCLEPSDWRPANTPDVGCADPESSGSYVALLDEGGRLVRYYADTFWGYVPGCYSPRATWSADGRDLRLDSAGKIECPE